MVIAYKMSELSYRIMRGKGYMPYYGLPNILSGEFVVPEFIQEQARPETLGAALLAQLHDPQARESISRRFHEIHESMRLGCANRAAQVLMDQADAANMAPAPPQLQRVQP